MISTQQLLEMVKEMSAIIQQNKDFLTELDCYYPKVQEPAFRLISLYKTLDIALFLDYPHPT